MVQSQFNIETKSGKVGCLLLEDELFEINYGLPCSRKSEHRGPHSGFHENECSKVVEDKKLANFVEHCFAEK